MEADEGSVVIHIKKMNMTSLVDSCRICMGMNSNMSSIFETESEHIVKEILFCTGVRLKNEDGFPTKICIQCEKDLAVAYKFKTSCILAEKTFRKLIINTIKAEVPEITDVDYEENIEFDDFDDKVKDEVEWEPVVIRNVGKKQRLQKEASQSVLSKRGRPKSVTATLCPLKKCKFKKLHCEPCDIKFTNKQQCDDHQITVHKESNHWDCEVKEEVEWEPVVIRNVGKKERLRKQDPQSVLPKQPPKRVGRPKSATAAPRPLKKYKFKKLHCEPCDIKFTNKQQCDDHKKAVHKESNHWVCEICGKLFVHRASHYTHVKSHLPPQFACDQCDYKTWHKYDLVKHIRIHTGIKMYQCEYCTASYYTSSNLTGHIRRNHMKQRPFECTICRRTFFDRTKLNRHVDSHNEIKRFECEVCHACFTRRCYWKKHLLRQHDIVTPPQRPGRQKINAVVGEELLEKVNLVVRPRNSVGDSLGDKTNAVDEYVIERVD